jgi:hypothetical protein
MTGGKTIAVRTGTHFKKGSENVPGPGSYNVSGSTVNLHTGKSFGGRYDVGKKKDLGAPGPGAY